MVIKRMLEGNVLVAGGGAVECALSIYLENFATTLGSREQLAIAEFAEALLVIPKTLAVNAAQDATELVSKLRAFHYTSQTKVRRPCSLHTYQHICPYSWSMYVHKYMLICLFVCSQVHCIQTSVSKCMYEYSSICMYV
jgi:TCP-1/cpn60 chaperonin family